MSSQNASSDVGERVLEDVPVEERLADVGPAGAGEDQRREPAEHDDRRDRRDRGPRRVARPPRGRALGAAVGGFSAVFSSGVTGDR